MEKFFGKPTPQKIVEGIYSQIIFVHETGGSKYRYQIPNWMSNTFITEVIDRLSELLLDVDILENKNGYIVIDWS